jgi:gluconolactonase
VSAAKATDDWTMPVSELEDVRVVAEGLAFPEGPVVLGDGSVAVVELRRGVVSRCGQAGDVSVIARTGGKPSGAALGPDGHLYVATGATEDPADRTRPSIQRVDIAAGSAAEVYAECEGIPFGHPDDLVFDETGMFWFTDLGGGAVYYASPDGSRIERVIDDATTPNGIGLSPDGTTLYWAQTVTRQLVRRRLRAPGQLVPTPGYSIRDLIHRGEVNPDCLVAGLPGGQELDSLAVEASGRVCVGALLESGIVVAEPDGPGLEKYVLPDDLADGAVTNICFGGEDMRTAYITLSLTGRLISCRWPRPGLRLPFQPSPMPREAR